MRRPRRWPTMRRRSLPAPDTPGLAVITIRSEPAGDGAPAIGPVRLMRTPTGLDRAITVAAISADTGTVANVRLQARRGGRSGILVPHGGGDDETDHFGRDPRRARHVRVGIPGSRSPAVGGSRRQVSR